MNWTHVRQKFQVIDSRGLSHDTVITLRLLIVAVMGGTVWGNITCGIAITGYWKELGASDFLYGVMLSLSPIANAFQFIASYFLEKTRARKKIFITAGLIQRMSWIPFALVPFIVPMSAPQLRLFSAAVLMFVSAAMAPFMNVAFYSICDDVIPLRTRGRYFASRSKIATTVGLIVGFITGILLDAVPGLLGYTLVFMIAGVLGTADIICFFFMKLPPLVVTEKKTGMMHMLGGVLRDKKYMRLVTFFTVWWFALQLSSPYFNVYMRDRMAMSNLDITIFSQIFNNIALVFVVSKWGRALDKFGCKPVIFFAGIFVSLTPVLWTFILPGMNWAVGAVNILAGLTWCACDLGGQNMFMGQGGKENKSMYFAVYFMFTQLIGVALGGSVGGFLLDNVLVHMENMHLVIGGFALTRYNYLFALSGIVRLCAILFLLPRVEEAGSKSVREMLGEMKQELSNFKRMIRLRKRA